MAQTNKFRHITIGPAAVGANALGALAVGCIGEPAYEWVSLRLRIHLP